MYWENNKKWFLISLIISLIILFHFLAHYSSNTEYKDLLKTIGEDNISRDLKGAATPEETLKIFSAHLKENNLKTAIEYITPESRAYVLNILENMKREGSLLVLAEELSSYSSQDIKFFDSVAEISYISQISKPQQIRWKDQNFIIPAGKYDGRIIFEKRLEGAWSIRAI